MRFKRGSKVEVINKKHSPASWHRAEILSGQEIGQVVQVFDDSCWKTATVMKVLNNDYYLVRLTGSLKQLCVHRSNTRVLQFRQEKDQDLIGKGSGLCKRPDQLSALKPSKKVSKVPSFSTRNRFHVGDNHLAAQECTELQKSHIRSSLFLNRASHVNLSKNETSRNIQELEVTERASKRRRVVPAALMGQVNVSSNLKENKTGQTFVHNSWNDVADGYCVFEQTKRIGSVGYFLTRSAESSDSHSDASSVGSCSINDASPNKFSDISPEVRCQGTELLHSDAQSSLNSADKEERHTLSSPKNIGESIHSLELHAYRCTLEALYASGPLSWDQEALLTNLRIALHISNDEHLAELRTLISAGTGQQLDAYILCLQKSKDDACICSTSPGILGRTPATTVLQIRQFMAFCVIIVKLDDLFCHDIFNIFTLFAEESIHSNATTHL